MLFKILLVLEGLSINNKSMPLHVWFLVTASSELQQFYFDVLLSQSFLVDNAIRVSNKHPHLGEHNVVIVFTF